MADARIVLSQRDALDALAARDGLTLSDSIRPLFESGSLADASARVAAERNAVLSIAQADGSRAADDDVLSRIGMLGAQPDADLAAARASLASGDVGAALAGANHAYGAWTGAWQEGRRRAMLAFAAIAALLILVSAAGLARRRGRRAATARGRAPTPRSG